MPEEEFVLMFTVNRLHYRLGWVFATIARTQGVPQWKTSTVAARVPNRTCHKQMKGLLLEHGGTRACWDGGIMWEPALG